MNQLMRFLCAFCGMDVMFHALDHSVWYARAIRGALGLSLWVLSMPIWKDKGPVGESSERQKGASKMSRGEKVALVVTICGGTLLVTGAILMFYLLWRGLTTHEWLDDGFIYIQIRAIALCGVGYALGIGGCLALKGMARRSQP